MATFFWIYWDFEIYLSSYRKRIEAIKFYLLGSIPVLLSGLGQYFLNWHGPFNILNGFIVWFQRPLAPDEKGFLVYLATQTIWDVGSQ